MKRLLFFVAFMTLATTALFKLLVTEPASQSTDAEAPTAPEANVINLTGVTVVQRNDERVRWELRHSYSNRSVMTM